MRQLRLISFILSLFFSLSVLTGLEASTLHAILIADTLDCSIGPSTRGDLVKMQNLAKEIASKAKMGLNLNVLKGIQVCPQRVFSILKELSIQADDAVIFYFSGHGYRTLSKSDDIWPTLYFSVFDCGADFTAFHQILLNKNPRMVLAIADCCNNVLPENNVPPMIARGILLKARSFNNQENANLEKLFAKSKGYFLISSSVPGQYSWSMNDGGLFTLSFLDILQNELFEEDTSWDYIFFKTIKTVIDSTIDFGVGVQVPQFLSIPID